MQNYDLKDIFNLPLRIQMGVVAIFCLLIVYIGYQWDIASLKRELLTVQAHESDLQDQLKSILANLTTVENDIAQLPALKKVLTNLQDNLVKADTLPDNLNEILKMGTANQLQFQIFSPGAEIKDAAQPNYRRTPINTIVVGEYSQIANFLSQIANMPTLVVINNLALLRGMTKLYDKKEAQEPGYANRISAAISLDVYRLVETTPENTRHVN